MPGWHAKTNGKLKVAGIVQEQHPDRAALYMQWQQMDWPVLADSFNQLEISAVPITLLIDQHGIIRSKNPNAKALKNFLTTQYEDSAPAHTKIPPKSFEIDALKALKQDALTQFQLGVTYRKRFDSPQRQPNDFANALASWKRALDLNPSQYIWRRRIQQYGPRLDKPYSFYDWVNKARKDIIARGETPLPLTAEPGGSEFAYPEKAGATGSTTKPHPDPDGKLSRDTSGFVSLRPLIVPSTSDAGNAVRVHLRMNTSAANAIHWTDEAGLPEFFLAPGSTISIHDFQAPPATPTGERTIEFELRPAAGKKLPATLNGAVFYNICEDIGGICQYLRQDLTIPLK